jgi:hypothetical protein
MTTVLPIATRLALRAALLALPLCAAAQGGPLDPEQRTWLQFNVTNASFASSTGSVDNFGGGTATRIDQERDLGLEDRKAMPGLLIGRRIGERFRIEGELVRSRRTGSTVLAADTTVDGTTWAGGTPLRTEFALRTTRISGGYSAVLTPEVEFGVSFGGQILSVRRALEGTHSGGFAYAFDDSDSTAHPLLGLYGGVKLGPMFRLSGRVESGVGDDDYVKLDLSATFRPLPHVGIGVGWRYVDARFANETFFFGYDNFGQLRFRARGPMLLLEVGF